VAGNTAVIDQATLREQWDSYIPMSVICQHWNITTDQLVRLRSAWNLPLRLDRKRRYKPSRNERMLDPTPEELAASENSLALAPMVAARATCESALWTDEVRAQRQAVQPTPFRLARIEVPGELLDEVEESPDW
jgi:hypothetical protein